jgi:MFS family permease
MPLRASVQAVIALAFLTDAIEVWHLIVSSAVFGVASSVFGPASTGLVPQVVSAARLQQANALLGLSRNGTELFGPALAGVLVATVGYSLIFAIDAASFVASLVCLALMPRVPRLLPRMQSFLADAREGFGEVLVRLSAAAPAGADARRRALHDLDRRREHGRADDGAAAHPERSARSRGFDLVDDRARDHADRVRRGRPSV